MEDKFRIVTWNVNGIRNIFSYQPWCSDRTLKFVFEKLEADVVCFQEHKLKRSDLTSDLVNIDDWTAYYSFSESRKGYSGVSIYTNNKTCSACKAEQGITGILHSRLFVQSLNKKKQILCSTDSSAEDDGQLSLNEEYDVKKNWDREIVSDAIEGHLYDILSPEEAISLDSEGRCLMLDFGLFILINTYCPAVSVIEREQFRMRWLKLLRTRIERLTSLGREVILVGDINICASALDSAEASESIKNSPDGTFSGYPHRQWLKNLLAKSPKDIEGIMLDSTRQFFPSRAGMYTCWNTKMNARPGNYGTRLDYCLVSKGLWDWVSLSNTMPHFHGSDHCPVYLDLKLTNVCNSFLLDQINLPSRMKENVLVDRNPPVLPKFAETLRRPFLAQGRIDQIFKRSKRSISEQESFVPQAKKPVTTNQSQSSIQDSEQQTSEKSNPTFDSSWQKIFSKPEKPKCSGHGETCIELVTKKPGPNKGRSFWICPRPVGPGYDNSSRDAKDVNPHFRCDYFKWAK